MLWDSFAAPFSGPEFGRQKDMYVYIYIYIYIYNIAGQLDKSQKYVYIYIYTHINARDAVIKKGINHLVGFSLGAAIADQLAQAEEQQVVDRRRLPDVHIHIYTYTHIHVYTYTHIHIYTYTHIHIHICMYVCMYVCMYIYIYICVCTHMLLSYLSYQIRCRTLSFVLSDAAPDAIIHYIR